MRKIRMKSNDKHIIRITDNSPALSYLYSCATKNVPLMSQPFGFFRLPLNTFL